MTKASSYALIVDDGCIFVIKRNVGGTVQYCLPGGPVSPMETPLQSVSRHIFEQAGFLVGSQQPLEHLTAKTRDEDKGENETVDFFLFLLAANSSGKPTSHEYLDMLEEGLSQNIWLSAGDAEKLSAKYEKVAGWLKKYKKVLTTSVF
ncbi:MAG: NUDIX domain-containing protein [Alphaproteobacteria bacterium]|nr:NUDIX domain-containing protein [Alphaproteobacteria bacterium]